MPTGQRCPSGYKGGPVDQDAQVCDLPLFSVFMKPCQEAEHYISSES